MHHVLMLIKTSKKRKSSCVDDVQDKIPKWRRSSCVDDIEVKKRKSSCVDDVQDEEMIMSWSSSQREGPSCVDGDQVKDASCVDAYQVKNPDLKRGCASSSFKWLRKAKVWLARAKDVFLVFYQSWCLVEDRIASIGCRIINWGLG